MADPDSFFTIFSTAFRKAVICSVLRTAMVFIGRTWARPADEDYVIVALKLAKSIPEIGKLISALRPAELNRIINIVSTRDREMIRSDRVDRNLNTIDNLLLELGDRSAMKLVEIIAKEAATVVGNAVSSVIQHAFGLLNASFTEDNPKLIDDVMGNTEIAAAVAAVDFFIRVTAASVTGNVYGDAETLFENVLRAVLNSIPEATRVVQDAAETGFQTSLEAAFRPSTKGAVGASADGAAGAAANDVVAAVSEKVGERAAAEAVARTVADVSGSHNVPFIVENPELAEAAQNNAKEAATEAAEEVLSGVVADEAARIDDLHQDVQNVLDSLVSKVVNAIPYALREARHAAEASLRDSAEASIRDSAEGAVGAAADINDVVAAVSEKVGERAAAEAVAGDGFARAVADVSGSHNVPFIVENHELVEAAQNNAKEAATEAAEEVLSGVVANEAARIADLDQDVQNVLDSLVSKVANAIPYALHEARHAAEASLRDSAEAAVGAAADINDVVATPEGEDFIGDVLPPDALHNVGMLGSLSDFSSETESTASSSYVDAPESIASGSGQFHTPQYAPGTPAINLASVQAEMAVALDKVRQHEAQARFVERWRSQHEDAERQEAETNRRMSRAIEANTEQMINAVKGYLDRVKFDLASPGEGYNAFVGPLPEAQPDDHLAQLFEGAEQLQDDFIPELLQRTPESTPERLEDVLMPDPILKTPEDIQDEPLPELVLQTQEQLEDEPLPQLIQPIPEHLEDEPLPELLNELPEPSPIRRSPSPTPASRRSLSPRLDVHPKSHLSSSRVADLRRVFEGQPDDGPPSGSSPRSPLMETTAPKERSFVRAPTPTDKSLSIAEDVLNAISDEAQKKKTFVENMRDDAILLIEWFKDKFEGPPQQKRDLRDLQLTFIKLTINGGRRRYLLPLSLRVKEMAEEKLQHGDQTDYRPIISMLISGYFYPELYRTYIQGEAPKELVAVERRWMNHLERLVVATMLQDPKEKTGEVAKEKWKVELDMALKDKDLQIMQESIINQMKIAAEEALHEELRWGQEWLNNVELLVDAAVFEKKVPTVSERRAWYNPRRLVPTHFESPRRHSFEYEVMSLVEESFTNGPGGIAQAAAAIRAVVEAVPGHFETETSPAAAASPVAAALRAAVRVIHYTGVARGLHRGDIDAALEAVKKLPTIRKIEPSRIAAALKSVLQAVVRREDDGSHSIKTDMALREVGAALDALNQEDAIRLAVTVAEQAALVASAAVSASISSTSGALNASSIGHNPELVEAAMGNAEEAAANVAVGVLSVACANGATNIINEDNPDGNTLAKNIVEALINATPEAARDTLHAAEAAVEAAADINNVVAEMASFNLVHDEDLNQLPKEERKCLVQTAKKYIHLGEKNRREPTFFEHLGQAMEKFGKLYLEKLFKQMVVILRSKNSFDSGVATALVAVHRYLSRIQLKMNLQKTNAASDIQTDKLRSAVMDALHSIKTLHNRPVEKRKTMLRSLVENIYKTHKARGVEHLIMAMAWDDKDKRGLSKLYDMIAFMHDFVLSAR